MTFSPPGGLALFARQREEAIESLRAYVHQLGAEKARAEAALHRLTGESRRSGTKRGAANGTYRLLRAYVAELRASGCGDDITAGAAAEWMLAHGWRTTAPDPRKTASSALSTMARFGELRWVGRGRYRDFGEDGNE